MKKVLLVLILILGAVAGTGYYFYSKITYRPSWYHADPAQRQTLPAVDLEKMEKRIKNDLKRGKAVTIPVEQLVSAALAKIESKAGLKLAEAVKDFRTTITSSGIEVEAMADLSRLPSDRLPAEARKLFDRVVKALPSRSLAEIYVCTRLSPLKTPDGIRLDPSSGVDIGRMNIPLQRLEEALGKKANVALSKIPIKDFSLTKEALVLMPAGTGGKK